MYPDGVSIEIVFPPLGTVPANVTAPPLGATTLVPAGAPTSMPRC